MEEGGQRAESDNGSALRMICDGFPPVSVGLAHERAAVQVTACSSAELSEEAVTGSDAGGVPGDQTVSQPEASAVAGKPTDFCGGSSTESPHAEEAHGCQFEICSEGNDFSLDASASKGAGLVADGFGKLTPLQQDRHICADAGACNDGNARGGGPDAESSEDERFNSSVKTDRYGFFVTSERRKLDVSGKVTRATRLKESKRAEKWRTMIGNFDDWQNGKKGGRLRGRVRKGVPDCVRGKVWQMMTGSATMMELEPNKYADLVASDLPVDGPIAEDIPRTMYDHELFCRKSRVNGKEMLRRVLTAYGRYDREVQYCQGINYICSLFLLYMPEENAFWMLVAIMKLPRAPLRELFLPGMMKAQEFQFVVDSLTEKYCKKLSNHILANNLTPAMYATQWFLTAFTQRFPYDLVTRVWDMFLLEGWKVFYRVCLALFKSVEREAAALDLESMNLLLRDMPPTVDAQKILDIAASIPLKHRHIEKRILLFHGGSAQRKEGAPHPDAAN